MPYIKKVFQPKPCDQCQRDFTPKRDWHRFCQKSCATHYLIKNKDQKVPIASGIVGTIAELVVSARLMTLGFEVYRALSGNSSCDILCIKSGNLFRFEIRSARVAGKKLYYSRDSIKAENLILYNHVRGKMMFLPSDPEPFSPGIKFDPRPAFAVYPNSSDIEEFGV